MAAPSFFVSIYSQILFAAWLIIAGTIYWGLNKRAGFQLLYLTIVSLSIGYMIIIHFPYLYLSNEMVSVTHPQVQATVTLFAFLLPLCKRKLEIASCIAAPLIISIIFLFIHDMSAFTISGGILIGGFITYTFYRSLEWLGSMPDSYLFTFAIALPFFLSLLMYPEGYFLLLPGLLFGIGIGASLEQYKVRIDIEATARTPKIIAFIIGSIGIIFNEAALRPVFSTIPAGDLITGIFTGLWITLIIPFLMITANLYEQQGKEEQIVR